jgi:hypothetical protein
MNTTTITKTVLVAFSNGARHIYKTTKTYPEIRSRFVLGTELLTDDKERVTIEYLSIYPYKAS